MAPGRGYAAVLRTAKGVAPGRGYATVLQTAKGMAPDRGYAAGLRTAESVLASRASSSAGSRDASFDYAKDLRNAILNAPQRLMCPPCYLARCHRLCLSCS